MGHNEITGDMRYEDDNQTLIGNNENQSHFWFRLLLLCKKRWKLLLPILLTLIIGTSILIGLLSVHSHSEGKCDSSSFYIFWYLNKLLASLPWKVAICL